MDPQGQWAVIYFSKTLFTPEGVDIISRTSQTSPELIENIKTQMAADSVLKPHLSSLQNLPYSLL